MNPQACYHCFLLLKSSIMIDTLDDDGRVGGRVFCLKYLLLNYFILDSAGLFRYYYIVFYINLLHF